MKQHSSDSQIMPVCYSYFMSMQLRYLYIVGGGPVHVHELVKMCCLIRCILPDSVHLSATWRLLLFSLNWCVFSTTSGAAQICNCDTRSVESMWH